jgi:hypothetical protein
MPGNVTFETINMFGEVLPVFSQELPLTGADYPKLARIRHQTIHPYCLSAYSTRVRVSDGDRVLGFWSHDSEAADDDD